MSLVLKPPANVEEPPLGRNAAESSAQSRRNEATPARRGPPRPRQPRPVNQRHNNEARVTPSGAPRPPNNNRNQRRRRNNNNKSVPAANATNPQPNATNSHPKHRGQQRKQNNPASTTTSPANPPPGATNTPPINPVTGQPISKRAAKRLRAQARAAEAQQQQQAGQTTTQIASQAVNQAANQTIARTAAQTGAQTAGQAANRTTNQTRRQRQARANGGNARAPAGQASGSQGNPHRAAPTPRTPNAQSSNSTQPTVPRQQGSGSTANEVLVDSQLAHVAQATLEHLNRLSLEENRAPTLNPLVFNNDGWSDAFLNDASAGPESEDDSDEDTEVGTSTYGNTETEDPTEPTTRPLVIISPCSICLDVPDEYPALGPTANCTHDSSICASCLSQHISHAVQSQGSTNLTCPDAECRETMEYADVIRGAKDNQSCLDRYEALLLRRMLENDPNFVWCKNPACGWGQVHDSGEHAPIVICQACQARSCFTHDMPWHTDLTCEQYTAQLESRAAEDHASKEYVQQNTKACPNKSCGRPIEKNDGCDHMTCRRPAGCGHEFCWLCFADYGPIREDGNHRHAPSCRHYAPISAPDPLQSYYARVGEAQRIRRELYATPARPTPPAGPTQRERQMRLEDIFRPGPLNPVAPAQTTPRRDIGLPQPAIFQPVNPIPRQAPGTPAFPVPNPLWAQPPPPAPELPTPVRSWWSTVFGFNP